MSFASTPVIAGMTAVLSALNGITAPQVTRCLPNDPFETLKIIAEDLSRDPIGNELLMRAVEKSGAQDLNSFLRTIRSCRRQLEGANFLTQTTGVVTNSYHVRSAEEILKSDLRPGQIDESDPQTASFLRIQRQNAASMPPLLDEKEKVELHSDLPDLVHYQYDDRIKEICFNPDFLTKRDAALFAHELVHYLGPVGGAEAIDFESFEEYGMALLLEPSGEVDAYALHFSLMIRNPEFGGVEYALRNLFSPEGELIGERESIASFYLRARYRQMVYANYRSSLNRSKSEARRLLSGVQNVISTRGHDIRRFQTLLRVARTEEERQRYRNLIEIARESETRAGAAIAPVQRKISRIDRLMSEVETLRAQEGFW